MPQPIIADFFDLFSELKTLSLKDWTTLLPILIGFIAFLWRKMLSNALHKVLLFFKAPAMIEEQKIHLTEFTSILHRIEKNLAMHEARSRMLMSNLNVPMWEADAQGQWTWCNDELLALVGADLNSVVQDKWLHFVANEEVERVAKSWYDAIEKDRTSHQIFSVVNNDGENVRVRAYSELVKSENETVGVLGYLTILK